MGENAWRRARDAVLIAAMAFLMALNYQVFILHNSFAPAGLNGIATMVQYVFDFSVGYMTLIINIPLAVFAFFFIARRFALRTLLFTLVFSGALLLMQRGVIDVTRFVYSTGDARSILLAPVASGTVNGFIYGVVMRLGGSTGGTDYVAAYVHRKWPQYPFLTVLFCFNVAVAAASYFVYDMRIEPVILCVMYCLTTTSISDRMNKRGLSALKVEIITSHPDEIKRELIGELHHSVTLTDAVGGYSGEKRTLMICVINKHQITKFTEIISQYPDTFACVSTVSETLGNFRRDVH